MKVAKARLRDYVQVGSRHTQQINSSDFAGLEIENGWLKVTHAEGETLISLATVISVDLLREFPSIGQVASPSTVEVKHESKASKNKAKQ